MQSDPAFLQEYPAEMTDPAIIYIRRVMEELGLNATQLAARSGVASTTLTRPLDPDSGHSYSISRRTIEKIEAATGIAFRHSGGLARNPDSSSLVPVYNVEASAGHGATPSGEEIVTSLAFPSGYLKSLTKANPQNLAIIGVKGDSMIPTLSDDDVVMLDMSKRDLSFDGLFVIRDNGDGLLIKRIGRASKRGAIMVISDNRDLYPPIERLMSDLEVIGKVIWMGRKV